MSIPSLPQSLHKESKMFKRTLKWIGMLFAWLGWWVHPTPPLHPILTDEDIEILEDRLRDLGHMI